MQQENNYIKQNFIYTEGSIKMTEMLFVSADVSLKSGR